VNVRPSCTAGLQFTSTSRSLPASHLTASTSNHPRYSCHLLLVIIFSWFFLLSFCLFVNYEGRSINKLQNSIISVIFKVWKNPNIRFVRNFMLSTSCELYYGDVTVTSFIDIKCGNIAVQRITWWAVPVFCYSFSVGKSQRICRYSPWIVSSA